MRTRKNVSKEKMTQCPECGKFSIATIFWGYPGDMDWYLQAIKDKKIVGGGCCITKNDPKHECNYCGWRF